jgi:Anti-sigma-28 factor, FlgM
MVDAGLEQLAERIARGEYVVDAEAVAEAMLRRGFSGSSLVLVPAEVPDRTTVGAREHEPAPGGDAA